MPGNIRKPQLSPDLAYLVPLTYGGSTQIAFRHRTLKPGQSPGFFIPGCGILGSMESPLLKTKLYISPTRPELVSRPRLIKRLNAGLR